MLQPIGRLPAVVRAVLPFRELLMLPFLMVPQEQMVNVT
jgi:hypothetical protein